MKETVDLAYEIFSKYRADRPLDVCTDCCMKIEDEGLLASLPVRDIPVDLLSDYNDCVKPEKIDTNLIYTIHNTGMNSFLSYFF